MGQRLKTFVVIIINMLMLIAPVFPHHHHGKILCLKYETTDCRSHETGEGLCSDVIDKHHNHQHACDFGCITNIQLDNSKISQYIAPEYTFFTIIYLNPLSQIEWKWTCAAGNGDCQYVEKLYSRFISLNIGLRAPPFFIV